MKRTSIRVGQNELRLDVHNGRDPHLALRQGRLRPSVRIDKADLVHLCGLLTLASGGLTELTQAIEVLSIDRQRDD